MFQDRNSQLFIPDRICRIIQESLREENARQIHQLSAQLRFLEESLATGTSFSVSSPSLLPRMAEIVGMILCVKQMNDETRGQFYAQAKAFRKDLRFAKSRVGELVIGFVARSHESHVNQTQYLERISDAHHRFSDITIPRIEKRHESELGSCLKLKDELSKELQSTKRTLSRILREKRKMEESIRSLRNQLSDAESSNERMYDDRLRAREYEGRSSALETALGRERAENDGYLERTEHAAIMESAHQLTVAKLRSSLVEKDAEIVRLQQQLQECEWKLGDLGRASQLDEANQALLVQRREKMAVLQKERDQALDALASTKGSNFELQVQNDGLRKENARLENVLQSSAREVESLAANLKSKQALAVEMEELQEEVERRKKESETKDVEISDLRRIVASQRKKLLEEAQGRKEELSAKTEIKSEFEKLNSTHEELQSQHFEAERQIKQLHTKCERLEATIRKRDRAISQLQEQKAQLEVSLAELKRGAEQTSEEIHAQASRISQLEDAVQFSKQELQRKGVSCEELIQKCSQHSRERSSLLATIDGLESESRNVKKALETSESEKRSLSQSLQEQTEQNESMHDEIRNVTESQHRIGATMEVQHHKLHRLQTLFQLESDDDIVGHCEAVRRRLELLEATEKELLKTVPGASAESLVSDVSKLKDRAAELRTKLASLQTVLPHLDSESLRKVVQTNRDLQRNETELERLFGHSVTPSQIAEMKGKTDQIQRLLRSGLDETDPIESVNLLLSRHAILKDWEKRIPSEFRGSMPDFVNEFSRRSQELSQAVSALPSEYRSNFVSGVQRIVARNEMLSAAEASIPSDVRGDLPSVIKTLAGRHRNLQAIEQVMPLAEPKQVETFLASLDGLMSLLNSIFSILTGMNLNIRFPIASPVQTKLLATIRDVKTATENRRREVEALLARAKSAGFIGVNLRSAVDFIVEAAVDEVKQRVVETVHRELADVREVALRERTILENQKAQLNRRVDELRAQITHLQEEMGRKEMDLVKKLDVEKNNLRQVELSLEKAERVKEELIQLLSGRPADTIALETMLNARDLLSLKDALRRRSGS
jgi:chromosome segregation ATPase